MATIQEKIKVAKSFLSKLRSVWEETKTANRYSSVKLGMIMRNHLFLQKRSITAKMVEKIPTAFL